MKNKLLATGTMIAITGCASVDDVTKIVSDSVNVKYYYENGEVLNLVNNAKLTPEEKSNLQYQLSIVNSVKEKLKHLESNPEYVIKYPTIIQGEYYRLRAAYLSIYNIIIDNQSQYTSEELTTLNDFHNSLVTIDNEFTTLMSKIDKMRTLNLYIDTIFKIVSLM